jgi:hypothetical protein
MLHPIRRGLAGVLGDRPAIRPRQPREQAEHQPADSTSRLDPTEPVRDPTHQLIEPTQPPVRVYPEVRGHRQIILSPHNPRSSSGGRSTPGTNTPRKITIYGWSTDME